LRVTAGPVVATQVQDAYLERHCPGHGPGLLVSGSAGVDELPPDVCTLQLQSCWPIPREAYRFVAEHDPVVVLEDSAPMLEEHVQAVTGRPLSGRVSGHLPPEGSLRGTHITQALAGEIGHWPDLERKTSAPTAHVPYADVYAAITRFRRRGTFVATDVGSSVRACYPPFEADAAVALGSSIAVAGGAARSGLPAIAVIGDYGLLHSGLQSLIDISEQGLPVLVLVLVNAVQAKTGGQPVPAVDLAALIGACGVRDVSSWRTEEFDDSQLDERLNRLLHLGRPAVGLVHTRSAVGHEAETGRSAAMFEASNRAG
jgi:indolepyruvate ferredoxin oxidoreductase alpha subunit